MRLRLAAAPLIVLPLALLGGSGTASAAPAPAPLLSVATAGEAAPALVKPSVKISAAGRAAGFSPTKVTAKRTATSPVTCTKANYSFLLVNTTAAKQQLTVGGKPVLDPLPAHKQFYICAYSSKAFTVTFHLKSSPMATLTARFT